MKKLLFTFALAAGIALQSFATGNPVDGFHKINTSASTVKWVGKKVTGQHDGSIAIKEGQLQFAKGKLTGGNVTIDMSSIKVLDMEGEYAGKLEGHLKNDDFFGTDKFPNATLIITKVKETSKNNYDITGNLTIKGVTKPVDFKAVVTENGKGYKATSTIIIDRTNYNIQYGSGKFFDNLGDKAIYDTFELNVSLVTE